MFEFIGTIMILLALFFTIAFLHDRYLSEDEIEKLKKDKKYKVLFEHDTVDRMNPLVQIRMVVYLIKETRYYSCEIKNTMHQYSYNRVVMESFKKSKLSKKYVHFEESWLNPYDDSWDIKDSEDLEKELLKIELYVKDKFKSVDLLVENYEEQQKKIDKFCGE